MKKRVVVLEGDGVGPEIIREAVRVLKAALARWAPNCEIEWTYGLIGGASLNAHGVPLTDEVTELCRNADAVLLGAVGGPAWDHLAGEHRPEAGLLKLRKAMGLYANLRPMTLSPCLMDRSPLKLAEGVAFPDILMVRELTGGIYFGERGHGYTEDEGAYAWDTERYSAREVDRVSRLAFSLAAQRSQNGEREAKNVYRGIHSIDKANVLESSRLWRRHVGEAAKSFPAISLTHMYVDNCAMQLILNPGQFDVILTSNLFGDILSDEMSALAGSIGLMPSASLGDGHLGLYEPIHGSAPDLAGLDRVNPVGTMLSAAMMARYSLNLPAVAEGIERAVWAVISGGVVTEDLLGPGRQAVGTQTFGDCVMAKITAEPGLD